jgi:hypothetical protein
VQNCVQLVLAFGDSGTDALVFKLDCTVIEIGEYVSGVQCFEVGYLLMINNASDGMSTWTYNCSQT